jgi:glycerate 2-kinase
VTPLASVARAMFASAVAAVQPDQVMRRVDFTDDGVAFGELVMCPRGRLVLVALGKAAPGMVTVFLRRCRRRPDDIVVLAPDGVAPDAEVAPYTRFAGHPTPDARGDRSTRALLAQLAGLAPSDGVVLLLSGGASSLLAAPLPGVASERVADVTRALLTAGATIHELNVVRKHLLAATGGRLAATSAAPMLTLALSDVPGDDLATIGSGPAVADPTTREQALAVLELRGVAGQFSDLSAFLAGPARAGAESVKPDDRRLTRSMASVIASSADALAAAASTARSAGLAPFTITRRMHGEAREVGAALAALARSASAGAALLLAGETTVTVRGRGRGGRNLEMALAAATGLADVAAACVLAAGTDGVDGSSPAAGAVVDGATIGRAAERGRIAADHLADNDSWGFFDGLEETIVTGPTGTNVADLAFVLGMGQPAEFLPPDVVASDSATGYPL